MLRTTIVFACNLYICSTHSLLNMIRCKEEYNDEPTRTTVPMSSTTDPIEDVG